MASEYEYGIKRTAPEGGDVQKFRKIGSADEAVRVRYLKGGITLRTTAQVKALRALCDLAETALSDDIAAPEPKAPEAPADEPKAPAKPAAKAPAKPVKPAKPELAPVDPTWDLAEGDLDGTGEFEVVVLNGVQYWQALAS
jgi:hypothetical protein